MISIFIRFFVVVKDDQTQRMPLPVQRGVRKQNIKFLHNKIHLFSPECFAFIKRLVQSNVQQLLHILQQHNNNVKIKLYLTM